MRFLGACGAVALLAGCTSHAGRGRPTGQPTSAGATASGPRVIIDTDLGQWWDDASALGIANVLEQQRELKILAVVADVPDRLAVAGIDAIDTFYGHPDIPLGAVAGSAADTAPHGYVDTLTSALPHTVTSSSATPTAVATYRRALAAQADHSVTIVALGAYTNLAALLASAPDAASRLGGRALVRAKVVRLVVEDGIFPGGAPPLTNQKLDPAAARAVLAPHGWPTPITWVDGTTGIQTKVGGALCTSVPATNPMRLVYQAKFGCGPPGDGDWDGPTMLYAAGETGPFTVLGRGGAATLRSDGGLAWRPNPSRPQDRYVHVRDQAALNKRLDALLADG